MIGVFHGSVCYSRQRCFRSAATKKSPLGDACFALSTEIQLAGNVGLVCLAMDDGYAFQGLRSVQVVRSAFSIPFE